MSGEVGFLFVCLFVCFEDENKASSCILMTCAVPTTVITASTHQHLLWAIWGFQHFTCRNSSHSHNASLWQTLLFSPFFTGGN